MAARSNVLLALFRKFKEEGVEFAYPTQTLYVSGVENVPEGRFEAKTSEDALVVEGPLDAGTDKS